MFSEIFIASTYMCVLLQWYRSTFKLPISVYHRRQRSLNLQEKAVQLSICLSTPPLNKTNIVEANIILKANIIHRVQSAYTHHTRTYSEAKEVDKIKTSKVKLRTEMLLFCEMQIKKTFKVQEY